MNTEISLDKIGFYTMREDRCKFASSSSPLWRCELILTDRCNFSCPYCRGIRADSVGDLNIDSALATVHLWANWGLKNIRFSGGEPTIYPNLGYLVRTARWLKIENIAVSTNGSADISKYHELIEDGVNDFSISLDACCASTGDMMSGKRGYYSKILENIRAISAKVYTTVGIVVTPDNVKELEGTVKLAHDLGVADIRIISAAQYNRLPDLDIDESIIKVHPILKYRLQNLKNNRGVRGLTDSDHNRCPLVLDDMAVVGKQHFPCIIYLREGGDPIGKMDSNARSARAEWAKNHDTLSDSICRGCCLDTCRQYNNRYRELHG